MEPAVSGFWLSPQQVRLWSAQADHPESPCRSTCLVMIEGHVQSDALRDAINELVSRHEILRTVFRRQVGMKVPFQVVLDTQTADWETLSLRDITGAAQTSKLEQLYLAEQRRDIDLENHPVLHATLVELGEERSALILGVPGVCADSQTLSILVRQLSEIYAGKSESADEALRYVQFAQWQNDLLNSDEESALQGRQFWQKTHSSALPEPALPLQRQADAAVFQPEQLATDVSAEITRQLDSLSQTKNVSVSDILCTAWSCLLSRLCGEPAFSIGILLNGRGYQELEEAVGLFAKCAVIPVRLEGSIRFSEAAQAMREAVQQATEWEEHLNPGSIDSHIHFSYLDAGSAQQHGAVSFQLIQQESLGERFRLKLAVSRIGGRQTLHFHYDAAVLSIEVVARWAGYFQTLLAAALENFETPVQRLPLLSAAERHELLVDWNQTEAEYPKQCLHTLFEAQVARTPGRIALRVGEQILTYAQLNARANQLAQRLRALGVGPDVLVGLGVERSLEMMVALLAILKAGGAYVPLNPDNPKPRLAQQIAGAQVLLTQQSLLAQMPEFGGTTLCLDRDAARWANESDRNPTLLTTPEHLVYILYTSGSTGTPKGVAVRHRNLVNYSHFITQRLELGRFPEGLHFATVSTIGADLGNTCIFPSLIGGGCLHVISYEDATDPQRLARYLQQYPIDVLKIVPSHLQALLGTADARALFPRQYLILGGEALSPTLLESIKAQVPRCALINHYGPTETTVGSLTFLLKDYKAPQHATGSVPIGRPIANTQLYVLDALLQPVPPGAMGELYIAGAGVSAGYLNLPEKSAERFVANPFTDSADARMYRTGDQVRYQLDGNVEFIGRSDDQVKIRGFRIELGEIEAAISQLPTVKQAVVIAQDASGGEKRLLAFVVLHRNQAVTSDSLREQLKQLLPDYMVPVAIAPLPKIPLTANGKLDRQALPAPEQLLNPERAHTAPATLTEAVVAAIWAEVLKREQLSTTDNFFDLGGHSLMATQVISRIREHFHIEIAMRVIFESPTIVGVSVAVDRACQAGSDDVDAPIVSVSRAAYRVTPK